MDMMTLFREKPHIQKVYDHFYERDPSLAEQYINNMLEKAKTGTIAKPKVMRRAEKVCHVSDSKRHDPKLPMPHDALTHPETGETRTMKQWAEIIGVTVQVFQTRYDRLGNVPQIYLSKQQFVKREKPLAQQLAEKHYISVSAVYYRLQRYGDEQHWPEYMRRGNHKYKECVFSLAKKYQKSITTIYSRLRQYGDEEHWPPELRQ